eukprot:151335-Hanusia_phi.AAC.2
MQVRLAALPRVVTGMRSDLDHRSPTEVAGCHCVGPSPPLLIDSLSHRQLHEQAAPNGTSAKFPGGSESLLE